ncbi:MAG: hypothetical protein MJZ46_05880 [Bacteroidales bacterium]|nr:hypothetical protein [Bacteroidales bacterium]
MKTDYKSPDFYVGKELKWSDSKCQLVELVTSYRSVPSENSTDFIFKRVGKNDPERAIRIENEFREKPFPKALFLIDGEIKYIGFACLYQ